MFGTIYVLTNPFLSFLCIDSIKALRFEPFAPIVDNKAFKRLAFAISRFEVEGVEGVLTCGVVWLRVRIIYDLQFLLVIICTFAPKMVSTIIIGRKNY